MLSVSTEILVRKVDPLCGAWDGAPEHTVARTKQRAQAMGRTWGKLSGRSRERHEHLLEAFARCRVVLIRTDALLQSCRNHREACTVNCFGHCRNLGDDVGAIAAFFNHVEYARKLPLRAPEPFHNGLELFGIEMHSGHGLLLARCGAPHDGAAPRIPPPVPDGPEKRLHERRPGCLRHNEHVTHPENMPQDAPLDATWLADVVRRSLDEDLGAYPGRDVTTFSTIAADALVTGSLVMRERGVVAGLDIVREVVSQVAARFGLPVPTVTEYMTDGARVEPGTELARIEGVGHVVLVAERTILNLMSRACGVATHTRRWVDALEGTNARVLDTRKTTPTLRALDKFAVRCGGGTNKRFGLYDVAMIKDNHIVAAGSLSSAINAIRERFPDVPIQVEVENTGQAFEALDAGIDFLMIDNMAPADMKDLVAAIRAAEPRYGRVWLEATGGLTVESVRAVAEAGVDFMSVGALTHSSPIVDIGLDLT